MPLALIFNEDDPLQQGILSDFGLQGQGIVPQFVKGDKNLTTSLRPVKQSVSSSRPWDDDFQITDTLRLALGLPDQPAAGGTFGLDLDGHTTGMTALAYNIADSSLETVLSAASVAGGHPALSVELLSDGNYQVDGLTNGAVPQIVGDPTNLSPSCQILVSVIEPGDAGSTAQQIISIRQNPVAFTDFQNDITSSSVANPTVITCPEPHGLVTGNTIAINGHVGSTPSINGKYIVTVTSPTTFTIPVNVTGGGTDGTWQQIQPDAAVTLSVIQAATSSQDLINRIHFTPGTYGGSYQVTLLAGGILAACGVANPNMNADDFSTLLANHPAVNYKRTDGTPDNIIVSIADNGDVIVEFTGTLGGAGLTIPITSNSAANPTIVTTTSNHNLANGDTVTITGNNKITNGNYVATVLSPTTFSIPFNSTSGAGAGGTMFNTSEPLLTLANIDLMAPQGVIGLLSLNTINLYKLFYITDGDTVQVFISVERERVNGEVRTLLLAECNLAREIIDLASIVAMSVTDPDARYAQKMVTAKYRFKDDGTFELWNADQNLWQAVTVSGLAGFEVLNIGVGES